MIVNDASGVCCALGVKESVFWTWAFEWLQGLSTGRVSGYLVWFRRGRGSRECWGAVRAGLGQVPDGREMGSASFAVSLGAKC